MYGIGYSYLQIHTRDTIPIINQRPIIPYEPNPAKLDTN